MDLPPHIPEPVRAALAEAKARLRAHYGDRLDRLILYGSHARGEAHDESDVDVLVVLRGDVDAYAELRALAGISLSLMMKYDADVSLQPYGSDVFQYPRRLFIEAVNREGVTL